MWADNGYTGLTDWARKELDLTFKVVKKPPEPGRLQGAAPPMDCGTVAGLA